MQIIASAYKNTGCLFFCCQSGQVLVLLCVSNLQYGRTNDQ